MKKREDFQEQINKVASTNDPDGTKIAILMAIFEIIADIRDILTNQKDNKGC